MPITGFEYDVFVSYAGVNDSDFRDRLDESDPSKGWVEFFQERLSKRLAGTHEAAAVKVWHDKSVIKRGESFSPAIAEGVRQSAVFVALLSTPYLEREWCKKEISWFFERGADLFPFRIDNYCRLIPVWLEDLSQHDGKLAELLRPPGHPAEDYARDPFKVYKTGSAGVSHRYVYSSPRYKDDYEATLTELATRIRDLLIGMKARAPSRAAIVQHARPRFPDSKHVFLSATPHRLESAGMTSAEAVAPALHFRQRIRTALEQKEINVLDLQGPQQQDDNEHVEAVRAALRKADVSVHIVDIDLDHEFSVDGLRLTKQGLELAAEEAERRSGATLKRVIWISDRTLSATKPLPADQQAFISDIQSSRAAGGGISVVRGDIRTLLAELEGILGLAKPLWERPGKLPSTYISYQEKNRLHALDLREHLRHKLKVREVFDLSLPSVISAKKDKDTLSSHRSKMRTCEGLVVVYSGETSADRDFLHRYEIDIVNALQKSGKLAPALTLIYDPMPPPPRVDPGVTSDSWPIAHGREDPRLDELAEAMRG